MYPSTPGRNDKLYDCVFPDGRREYRSHQEGAHNVVEPRRRDEEFRVSRGQHAREVVICHY